MGKILKLYHEKSANLAKRDTITQNKLASGKFFLINIETTFTLKLKLKDYNFKIFLYNGKTPNPFSVY